jgi:hypothetical protein
LRGFAFVAGNEHKVAAAGPAPVVKFPPRPDPRVLSASIPLFFVGRNKYGFWVVRAAEGRTGGIFLLKRSALRFAAKNSAPAGCATMLLGEPFELDVENQGGVLAAGLDAMIRVINGARAAAGAGHREPQAAAPPPRGLSGRSVLRGRRNSR